MCDYKGGVCDDKVHQATRGAKVQNDNTPIPDRVGQKEILGFCLLGIGMQANASAKSSSDIYWSRDCTSDNNIMINPGVGISTTKITVVAPR